MGVGVGPVGTEIGGALRGLSSVTRVSSVPGFFERILGGFYVSDLFLCFVAERQIWGDRIEPKGCRKVLQIPRPQLIAGMGQEDTKVIWSFVCLQIQNWDTQIFFESPEK